MKLELGFKFEKDTSPNSSYYNHHRTLLGAKNNLVRTLKKRTNKKTQAWAWVLFEPNPSFDSSKHCRIILNIENSLARSLENKKQKTKKT